mmetsp:Transcript_8597/g.11634  ORF Transcript_8597/g.11634 Transcript_8597/m.11634 type:complete len:701 (+) Transcript_8597:1023-3125(+)
MVGVKESDESDGSEEMDDTDNSESDYHSVQDVEEDEEEDFLSDFELPCGEQDSGSVEWGDQNSCYHKGDPNSSSGWQRSEESFVEYDFQGESSPIDIFFTLLPCTMILDWVLHTNTSREMFLKGKTNMDVNGKKCPPITFAEMKGVIAILIIKGLAHIKSMEDAWSTNNVFENQAIKSIMSKVRFFQIWKFFHVVNPNDADFELKRGQPRYDSLLRVKSFYELLRSRLQEIFKVGGYCVVDEFLKASCHHVANHRFIKGKPNPHGLLFYLVCSTVELDKEFPKNPTPPQKRRHKKLPNLYIPHNFMLYLATEEWRSVRGPRGGKGEPPPEWRNYGEGGCFLIRMLQELIQKKSLKKGTTIVGDKAFSSFALMNHLKKNGLNYIGTVRKDKMPHFDLPKKQKSGLMAFRTAIPTRECATERNHIEANASMNVGWWCDSTWVGLMTLGYNWVADVVYRRKRYDKKRALSGEKWSENKYSVNGPWIVRLYNDYMGSVDGFNRDGQTTYHEVMRCTRYWKVVFSFLLQTWIYSSFCIYMLLLVKNGEGFGKKIGKSPQKDFRVVLANQLAAEQRAIYHVCRKAGNKACEPCQYTPECLADVARHQVIPLKNMTKRFKYFRNRAKCFQCKARVTSHGCIECQIPLCQGNCSMFYHKWLWTLEKEVNDDEDACNEFEGLDDEWWNMYDSDNEDADYGMDEEEECRM